jgi:hypothetical protein
MRLYEVGFEEETIANLNKKPLLRDNLKNIEKDFNSIYENVLNQDIEDVESEALIKIKSDLFAAFCHGAQMATRVDSNFRKGFVTPKEFGGKTIIVPNKDIAVPKKLDLIM